MELASAILEGSKQQLEFCYRYAVTLAISGYRLENVWKIGMVMSISILLVNPAIATEKSEITGRHLSNGVLENITDIFVPTGARLSLGAQAIKKPDHVIREENHTNSQVATEAGSLTQFDQFSQLAGSCTFSQVGITQDNFGHLPDGMPIFHVNIINNCIACSMEDVHVACGDFSSETLVDPAIFRRLSYDNCLVNNGGPILPLNLVYFEYSSSYSYPMVVKGGQACSCY